MLIAVLICLITVLTSLNIILMPSSINPVSLPITGIWRVTPSSMECFNRLHSDLRKYAPTLPLIIGVEHDVINYYGEHCGAATYTLSTE